MTDLNTTTQKTPGRDDNGVAPVTTHDAGSDVANILIVEHNADCADALEALFSGLPGIATVQMAVSAGEAIGLLGNGTDDVVGFGLLPDAPLLTPTPDVIFIGAGQPDTTDVTLDLIETLTAFRNQVPEASIVLLSVYSCRVHDALGDLIDGCIPKDTSARELHKLIEVLRAARAA